MYSQDLGLKKRGGGKLEGNKNVTWVVQREGDFLVQRGPSNTPVPRLAPSCYSSGMCCGFTPIHAAAASGSLSPRENVKPLLNHLCRDNELCWQELIYSCK